MEEAKKYLDEMITESLTKMVISNPKNKTEEYKKIVVNRKKNGFQIEKYTEKLRISWPSWLRYLVTLFFLSLNWPLFICETMPAYGEYITALFSFRFTSQSLFWLREYAGIILLGVVFCVPSVVEGLKRLCRKYAWLRIVAVLGTLLLCIASLVKSSYNPFLYFRF